MCDSENGFCLNWFCYSGKTNLISDKFSKTEQVVLDLIKPLDIKGHHIYMDNYYSSVNLYTELARQGYGACGTIRSNRKHLPDFTTKIKRGDPPRFFSSNNNDLLAVLWQDVKKVHALTSIHNNFTTNKRIR